MEDYPFSLGPEARQPTSIGPLRTCSLLAVETGTSGHEFVDEGGDLVPPEAAPCQILHQTALEGPSREASQLTEALLRHGPSLAQLVEFLSHQYFVYRAFCEPPVDSLGQEVREEPKTTMPPCGPHPHMVPSVFGVVENPTVLEPPHRPSGSRRVVTPFPQLAQHFVHGSRSACEEPHRHPVGCLHVGEEIELFTLLLVQLETALKPKISYRRGGHQRETGSVHLDDREVWSPRVGTDRRDFHCRVTRHRAQDGSLASSTGSTSVSPASTIPSTALTFASTSARTSSWSLR